MQWYDQHEELFFLVRKDMLYEVPSRANEHNSDEENGAFQEMRYVVQNRPRFHVLTLGLDEVVIYTVEQQWERLQVHQDSH